MSLSAEPLKIMIVDDSAVYRKLVERTLEGQGRELVFASSGEQAIELFAEHRPSIVITDWNMPDLSGIDVCRRIRTEFQDALDATYTYLIILTSNAEKENVVQGLAAGADDYLTKPFHADELVARVDVGRRFVSMHQQIEAKNRLLEELALTDSLTGLANRRAIEDWASRQMSGAARHGFAFWVVMVDLDNFKAVNDTHGHAAGDSVLKQFAAVVRRNTRRSNICGRVGGEEFMMVLTHAERDDVETVVERVRKQCEEMEFACGGAKIRVTASFGIAGFQGRSAPAFEDLLKRADAALYAAKRNGRNRAEVAQT